MAKKLIAQPVACDDADEVPLCPGCGEPMHPMSEDEMFTARMEAISEILADATAEDHSLMLGMLLGDHIGSFTNAKVRQAELTDTLTVVHAQIEETVARWRQHKRETRAIRRAGSHPVLLPDVSDRMQ